MMEKDYGLEGELESERVESDLRQMILRAELTPGLSVTQAELIKKLGCGRTPLREALHRLSATGDVIAVPNKGIYIPSLDILKMKSAFEALSAVYPLAMRLAAERITTEMLDEVKRIMDGYAHELKTGESSNFGMLDHQFHKKTTEASGNLFFTEVVENANFYLLKCAYALKINRRIAKPIDVRDEHQCIYYALQAKDPEKCEQAARNHFQEERANMFLTLLS